ncbi:hypothetical protein HOY82DRAFT_220325 [Tuber indicum]|nr:hypothetical protein HOY82DRAFT_220325 [Tuber indicum]
MPAHSEDGGSSPLEESTYELLSMSTEISDDEDDASSITSFRDNISEDNMSIEDSESLAEFQDDSPHSDPSPGIPAFGGLDEQHLDKSRMTLKDERFGSEQVVFEEPEDFAGEQISVSSRVIEFNEADSMDISQHLRVDDPPPAKLFATVRQTMSKHQLVMEEPFRILYVGATSAKDEITTKLGGALAVPVTESTSSSCSWESSKGSRFNVIPVSSFGARSSSPEVELVESFGVEMAVDVCTAARSSKRENRPETLSLWLNGNQSVSSSYGDSGPQLESPGWKLPHLAVVFSSEDDNTQRRMTRVYARAFMARHSVPTLVISQDPLYHKLTENYTLDTRSVHMCLESQSDSKYGHLVHKRLPIDLNTFLNLDVRQMNRNLACVTGISPKSDRENAPIPVGGLRTSVSSITSTNTLLRDVEKAPHQPTLNASSSLYWVRDQKREDLWKVFLVGWIFVCGLAGATFAIACMKFKSPMATDEALAPAVKSVTQMTTSASTVMSPTAVSVITSLSATVQHSSSIATTSPCSPKNDISSLVFDPNSLTLSQSGQFTVHVIGDNHLIIRPPQKYLLLRKPPTLFVEVTRGGDEISSELSKPLEGVYTLELDSEQAWGLVKISISTRSAPLISETLEVDFGSPWLKLSGWLKAVEQKKAEIQVIVEQTIIEAEKIANDLTDIAGKQAMEAKEAIVAKAKEITNGASKLYQGTKSITLKHYLPSVSKSEYVQKAQKQAKIVWGKETEKLSAKRKEVKRTGWLGR